MAMVLWLACLPASQTAMQTTNLGALRVEIESLLAAKRHHRGPEQRPRLKGESVPFSLKANGLTV